MSLDSVCYLDAKRKPAVRNVIERRVRRRALLPIIIEGGDKVEHWAEPSVLDGMPEVPAQLVHILSPFDPLIIQRKRLKLFFDYEHRFEAYVPKEKRVLGYFALPVLVGDEIVAAIDLKADRASRALKVQKWTWLQGRAAKSLSLRLEEALDQLEKFQFAP